MTLERRRLLQGAAALAALGPAGQAARASPGRKVLRLAFPAAETSFDPPQTNSDLYSTIVLSQIFEAPLGYDYLARPARLRPVTAEALPEVTGDGQVFTLRIKPGIYFADDPAFKGRPRELIAQDYVFSIKRFFDPQYNSSDLSTFEQLKLPGMAELRDKALKSGRLDYDTEVEGLRALDRYTLRFKLGVPDPRFVYRLASPADLGAVAREVVEFYDKDIGAHPVGTGAFRLKRWVRASRIELERSPGWRGEVYDGVPAADHPVAQQIAASLKGRTLPLVDELRFDIIEEDQPRWLSFANGDLAVLELPGAYAGIAVPNGKLAPFLKKKGVQLQRALQADMGMTYFYMKDPVVGGYTPQKVALRRAVALAFDGEAYVRHVHGGQGVLAQSVITPFTTGYDAAYRSEMSEHSLARAMALLDMHGYTDRDGDGWREAPDGQPLVLRLASMSNQRDRLSNEIWKRSLDRVGLRTQFEVSTWPELLKKSRAGALMMWGYSWSAGSPDGSFMLGTAYGPNASDTNDAHFDLPAFDRLYERQARMADGPEREAVIRAAKNLLVAYMPYKVHMHRIRNDLVQPGTHHYWRHPFMRDIWRYVDTDVDTRA